ncbi:zinc finger CCCH domain-containing protein 13-like [Coregonus clupeaformis]|uniref:zinc finger CCCH domain-containing protein 13-like n=1 Tax=Coregonus clupeaformis TaxID=59861 RepID=UPI001E1C6B42|nr:zinc finger CCCH domain-containing protein 13-like [Coregonus clupeaformis]
MTGKLLSTKRKKEGNHRERKKEVENRRERKKESENRRERNKESENRRERRKESENRREREKEENCREKKKEEENRRERKKEEENRRERKKESENRRERKKESENRRERKKESENRRERKKESENRRERKKESENRREREKGGELQGKEKGGGEPQGKEKGGGELQGKEKGERPQGKEKGVRELQGKEKGVRELQGKDDKRNKYRKRVRLWEGHGEGERAELFQRLPVLSKSKTVAQKPSLQTTSPSTPEEQVPSNCSGIGTGTIPEPQPSGQPQNSSPERSGETESDRDQVSPPAVKLAPSKGRAPTVSLKKFQELLKHRHQKTRKSAKSKEAKETESETEGEKQSEGKLKLLKPNEIDSGQNESRLMNKKKSYSQSLERESAVRPTVENYDQTNRTESDHPEEKDAGHNSSACGQETEYQELIYKETERENIEDREHFENTENVEDGENVDASGDFSELREELATLAMLSMTRTKKMVDPQRTDKGNKEGRDLVTKENRERETDSSTETNKKTEEPKGSMLEAYRRSVIIREVEEKMEDGYLEMEISSEEFDVVDEVHQTFGYAVTEEVSGEEEEIDVEEMCPTMYPDAAWQEVSGAREVDQSSSTMVSFRGITHNHFHMATAAPKMADVSLPTPLEAEPSTLTSSRRVTTGSIGSWEPEEEEEVEVDVLEWSPDVRPIVWGAGLEQGVTELTEEDLEEDEIDVMGEETD